MKKSPTALFVSGAIAIVVMLYLVKTGELGTISCLNRAEVMGSQGGG